MLFKMLQFVTSVRSGALSVLALWCGRTGTGAGTGAGLFSLGGGRRARTGTGRCAGTGRSLFLLLFLLRGAAGRSGAAPGAVARLGAGAGTRTGVAAGTAPALTSPAILKQLQLASIQVCPIQLGNGVLHIAMGCKLHHPFILVGSVGVHKGNLSDLPHHVFQVLPANS